MSEPHSPAFLAVRDIVLNLEDADRQRLAAFMGAWMQSLETGLPPALLGACEAIFRLPRPEQKRLDGWFRAHVNRWGQVPFLTSMRASHPDAPWDSKDRGKIRT
ncbi:hypothetical protein EPN42_11175 [bacterium]|nr:MAG: hypothetical protein EPN42_11175 [bacterium]